MNFQLEKNLKATSTYLGTLEGRKCLNSNIVVECGFCLVIVLVTGMH